MRAAILAALVLSLTVPAVAETGASWVTHWHLPKAMTEGVIDRFEIDQTQILPVAPDTLKRALAELDRRSVVALDDAALVRFAGHDVALKSGLKPYLVRAQSHEDGLGGFHAFADGGDVLVAYEGPTVDAPSRHTALILLLPRRPARLHVMVSLYS